MRRFVLPLAAFLWACPSDEGFPFKQCEIVAGHDEPGFGAVGMVVTATGTCTGTLVAPRVVVTAQHCFGPDTRAEQVGFVSGERGERLEAAGAALFYTGEFVRQQDDQGNEWWWIDTEDDFAVLALDHEPSVQPMPYRPDAVTAAEEGSLVDIVGYGTTALGAEDAGSKRAGVATLSWVGPDWLETERHAGESSGCYGDSGGPLVLGGEVVGVFSYFTDLGAVCESGGQYVRLDRFTSLIDRAADAAAAYVAQPDDGCVSANDGVCDEGISCYPGRDHTDCANEPAETSPTTPPRDDASCDCGDACRVRDAPPGQSVYGLVPLPESVVAVRTRAGGGASWSSVMA